MDSWCNQTFRWTQMFQYRWDLLIIVKQVKMPVTKWQSLVALCHLGLQKYALFQMSSDLFKCWLSQQLIYLILVFFGFILFVVCLFVCFYTITEMHTSVAHLEGYWEPVFYLVLNFNKVCFHWWLVIKFKSLLNFAELSRICNLKAVRAKVFNPWVDLTDQ